MFTLFASTDLPRYYVEHFPPMLHEEHDLEAFETLEDAEEFAEDCVRGGENARIFGEMARFEAGRPRRDRAGDEGGFGLVTDWPEELAA